MSKSTLLNVSCADSLVTSSLSEDYTSSSVDRDLAGEALDTNEWDYDVAELLAGNLNRRGKDNSEEGSSSKDREGFHISDLQ